MAFNLPDEVYDLHVGETANSLICPFCNGGAKRDRAFVVTRVERGFVFVCHREKCGKRGFVPSRGEQGPLEGSRPRTPSKDYTRPIEALAKETAIYVRERYGIEPATLEHFAVGWSPPQDDRVGRLVIPVLLPDGSEGGLVARALESTSEPKALTYIPRPGCMSWYSVSRLSNVVWVVEDQFSAMRLWQEGITAVALLGTHINHARALEISTVSRDVFIALDKDATAKAIGYASQFRYAFDAKVVALAKDIKDMGQEELKEFLNETCRN